MKEGTWIEFGRSKFYFVQRLNHRGQTEETSNNKDFPVIALKNGTRGKEHFSCHWIKNDNYDNADPKMWIWQKAKLRKQTNDYLREKFYLEVMESPSYSWNRGLNRRSKLETREAI